jgi:hypothetical protein
VEGIRIGGPSRRYLLSGSLLGPVALTVVLPLSVDPAFGASGSTNVQCGISGSGSCTLSASTPGQAPGAPVAPQVQPVSATAPGSNECPSPTAPGQTVPCTIPAFGWLGSDGCYYKPDPGFVPPPGDTADEPPPGETGGYYLVTCTGDTTGTGGGIVWLETGTAPGPATPPTLATLALQVVKQLNLPGFAIDASPSPGADQLVGLPSWLWLAGANWQPTTATAAVPGESVTAVATPTTVTWNLGDGTTLVCNGPGTPYEASDAPNQASPTCGHTFAASSAGQPNDAFTVTATISWSVTWAGEGKTGTVPNLDTTATTPMRVAAIESLNPASI